MTVIFILIALALIYLIACAIVFNMAFIRHKERMDFDEESIRKSDIWGQGADFVIKGRQWILSMPCEMVTITSRDGLKLQGRFLPNEADRGTIILCHGYRSNALNDMSGGASFYYSLGFNLLFIDQRSHQASEGRFITFGTLERYDLSLWVDWVLSRQGEDEPICLAGLSMGAATVLMGLGVEHRENIKCAVADCGFTTPWKILTKVAKSDYHLPFGFFGYGINAMCKSIAHFDLKTSSVEAISKSNVPILFIHGTGDNFIPYQMTVEMYQGYQGPKDLLLVEGADHGLSFIVDPEAYKKALLGLFDKYMPMK